MLSKLFLLLILVISIIGCAQPSELAQDDISQSAEMKTIAQPAEPIKTTEATTEATKMTQGQQQTIKKVSFQTSDGVTIIANHFLPSGKAKAKIILLHMLPETKESWNSFAGHLQKDGYELLAIDMRGWGESVTKEGSSEKLTWKKFSEAEFNEIVKDVEAAQKFLGADNSQLYIVGASIGANIAYIYGTQHQLPKIILLSPGLNYRGVSTENAKDVFPSFSGKMLIVVSQEDATSYQSVLKLQEYTSDLDTIEFLIVNNSGHGTDMFSNAEVEKKAIGFFRE